MIPTATAFPTAKKGRVTAMVMAFLMPLMRMKAESLQESLLLSQEQSLQESLLLSQEQSLQTMMRRE